MNSFKDLHKQYTTHKHAIQQLTGSIASDQLLLRLLQGLKAHVEKIEAHPDTKYSAFVEKLEVTIDQRTLDRAIRERYQQQWEDEEEKHLREQEEEPVNPRPRSWDDYIIGPDGYPRAPYT